MRRPERMYNHVENHVVREVACAAGAAMIVSSPNPCGIWEKDFVAGNDGGPHGMHSQRCITCVSHCACMCANKSTCVSCVAMSRSH